MKHTKFDVAEFKNQSGAKSWRVEGRIDGLRIRRNFPTREDANAERTLLEIRALQAEAGIRTVATDLADGQVRDAEAAFPGATGCAQGFGRALPTERIDSEAHDPPRSDPTASDRSAVSNATSLDRARGNRTARNAFKQ
jgi:hypothetical protein